VIRTVWIDDPTGVYVVAIGEVVEHFNEWRVEGRATLNRMRTYNSFDPEHRTIVSTD
jgi:hypothetical protein